MERHQQRPIQLKSEVVGVYDGGLLEISCTLTAVQMSSFPFIFPESFLRLPLDSVNIC